jgi:UTP--glucose-1-phosphate uridylyltransferase
LQVTDKTRGDVQGGTLIEYEGKAKLLELAQVPRDHEQDFKSLKTFTCFNTNNLWASLKAVKTLIAADLIQSTVIVNERIMHGTPALQLETAAGAAIEVRNDVFVNFTFVRRKLSRLLFAVLREGQRHPRAALSVPAREEH